MPRMTPASRRGAAALTRATTRYRSSASLVRPSAPSRSPLPKKATRMIFGPQVVRRVDALLEPGRSPRVGGQRIVVEQRPSSASGSGSRSAPSSSLYFFRTSGRVISSRSAGVPDLDLDAVEPRASGPVRTPRRTRRRGGRSSPPSQSLSHKPCPLAPEPPPTPPW